MNVWSFNKFNDKKLECCSCTMKDSLTYIKINLECV